MGTRSGTADSFLQQNPTHRCEVSEIRAKLAQEDGGTVSLGSNSGRVHYLFF